MCAQGYTGHPSTHVSDQNNTQCLLLFCKEGLNVGLGEIEEYRLSCWQNCMGFPCTWCAYKTHPMCMY